MQSGGGEPGVSTAAREDVARMARSYSYVAVHDQLRDAKANAMAKPSRNAPG